MSVKDYGPLLPKLWHDAATAPAGIHLPFGADGRAAINRATTQRHRLYRLRIEMRKEGHPWADDAFKCKISIKVTLKSGKAILYSHRQTWGPDDQIEKVELHIVSYEADTSLEDALAAAGYSVPTAPEIDL